MPDIYARPACGVMSAAAGLVSFGFASSFLIVSLNRSAAVFSSGFFGVCSGHADKAGLLGLYWRMGCISFIGACAAAVKASGSTVIKSLKTLIVLWVPACGGTEFR